VYVTSWALARQREREGQRDELLEPSSAREMMYAGAHHGDARVGRRLDAEKRSTHIERKAADGRYMGASMRVPELLKRVPELLNGLLCFDCGGISRHPCRW
jgi:hypothetical protein